MTKADLLKVLQRFPDTTELLVKLDGVSEVQLLDRVEMSTVPDPVVVTPSAESWQMMLVPSLRVTLVAKAQLKPRPVENPA